MNTCAHLECGRDATRRGLCAKHYQRHWYRGAFAVRDYVPTRPTHPTGPVPKFPQAACRGVAGVDWVPEQEHLDEPNTRAALAICHTCPHELECGTWAIGAREHGLWGGLTTGQREQLRRDSVGAAR